MARGDLRRSGVRRSVWIAVLLVGLVSCGGTATAATLEPIGTFSLPVYVTSDPLDPDWLLIGERQGRVIERSPAGTRQLLDFSTLVTCCESERGLDSIVPAPDFAATGRVYAAYTGAPAAGGAEGDVHIDSFRPGPSGQAIREPILSLDHSLRPNHNGGQLQFGPDGYLYIALGDGGGAGDPDGNGQNTETLSGKIIRIDPRPGQVPSYAIPPGNPFASGPGRDEIWAFGLRNPWRFSFDRANGDMVIADVGQDEREEVDLAPSAAVGTVSGGGANYGWNCREGTIVFPGAPSGCPAVGFTDPVFDYPHDDPGGGAPHGCSIIGGYVIRDPSLGDLYGRYVYTDYCQGEIRSLVLPSTASGRASGDRSEALSVASPTSFGEDACGRVYVVAAAGAVFRLEGAEPATCPRPTGTGVGSGPSADPPPVRGLRRASVRLHARRSGAWVKLTARVSPCGARAGAMLQLNRGGKRLISKRLDEDCLARFAVRLPRDSTFRVLLRDEPEIRSRRLAVPRRR
jgi:hypothetical protein